MFNDKIIQKISDYYPEFKILFKDESKFMKILDKLLFWSKDFMTRFTTTIGSTVYFPSKTILNSRPVTSFCTLLHELVHIYDSNRLGHFTFACLYLSPQILIVLVPLLLFFSWKIALVALVLSILPFPSYFRTHYEKRAYFVSLYVMNALNQKFNYKIDLDAQKSFYIKNFKDSSYYFMWPFASIDKDFDEALSKIREGRRPYEDKVFDMLDDILAQY